MTQPMSAGSGRSESDLVPPDARTMLDRLATLAEIGSLPDRAMNRLPYTAADQQVREIFAGWAADAGLGVRVDAVGNVVARLDGSEDELAPIMVGSHLDTQPSGGMYDGIAGTLAALSVAESLLRSGIRPRRAVDVVAWAGEEGSGRFDVGCIGSRAMLGALTAEHLALRCRLTGQTLAEAMRECGLDPDAMASCELPSGALHAVLELHIEQGPYLEESGVKLGVVHAISGNRRVPVRLTGVQAHSGAQPMSHRRDALTAAAEIILMAESEAEAAAEAVATSGMFEHRPCSIAAVPGVAELTIDVRSPDAARLLAVESRIRERIAEIGKRRGVQVELGPSWGMDPTETDPGLVSVLEEACARLSERSLRLNSGAGHDSLILGKRFPAGLLFVPSKDGLSHCPQEYTSPEDLAVGVRALQLAVAQVASA